MGPKLEITSGTGLEPTSVNRLEAACWELQGVWRFPGTGPGYLLPSLYTNLIQQKHFKWKRAVLRANRSPSLSLHDLNWFLSPLPLELFPSCLYSLLLLCCGR